MAPLTDAACPQTPVTSSPLVAGFLSNLPAYRIGVSPLLRGVEIGLVHGFLVTGQHALFRAQCIARFHDSTCGIATMQIRTFFLAVSCSGVGTALGLYAQAHRACPGTQERKQL